MRIRLLLTLLTVSAFSLVAFNTGFLKTQRGLYYKILKTSKAPNKIKIKQGDFVRFHLVYKTDKDSVLSSSYARKESIFMPVKIDTSRDKAQLNDALLLLSKGDSATFKISSNILLKGAPTQDRPAYLAANRFLCYTIKVLDVKTSQQMALEKKAKAAKLKATEDKAIATYAIANKLNLQTTPSGLRYQILTKAEGQAAKAGDTVTAHYSGKLLNGNKFDASYDRNQPFQFILGKKQVISGWDEGFQLLKPGEKAVLVLPSGLAYGEHAMGPAIPENSVLVFEVELLKVGSK